MDLFLILLIAGNPIALVFGVAQEMDNRRKGIETTQKQRFVPVLLVIVVFGGAYLIVQLSLLFGAGSLGNIRIIAILVVTAIAFGVRLLLRNDHD